MALAHHLLISNLQTSIRDSREKEAFAGLVEGIRTGWMLQVGNTSFMYRLNAVAPLQRILLILYLATSDGISFATTFWIEESAEPVILHDAATSHSAMPWESSRRFLSSMTTGSDSHKTTASIFQNLLRGCP